MSYRARILPLISLVLIMLITSTVSHAANRRSPDELPWYEIEIIVFANKEQKGLDTETWPENVNTKEYPHLIQLHFPTRNRNVASDAGNTVRVNNKGDAANQGQVVTDIGLPEAFAYIRRSEFKLGKIQNQLAKSSKYELLMHLGWRQPTAAPHKALPVYLYQGMDDPNYRSALDAGPDAAANTITTPQGQAYPIGPRNSRFFGMLTLSVSRYLHVDTDLNYRTPVVQQEYVLEQPESGFFSSSAEPVEKLIERNVLLNFNMTETRRLRSKEIHYYDHPMFGMIVLVTPYDVTGDS